jgi:Flp pilus assembly protein TadD
MAIDQYSTFTAYSLAIKGLLLSAGGRLHEAISVLEEAVSQHPKEAQPRWILAHTYTVLDRFDEALLLIQEANKFNPQDATTWGLVGDIRIYQGRHSEAVAAWQRAVDLEPSDAANRINLASSYRKAGRSADCTEEIRIARTMIEESEGEYKYNRACLEALCGNVDDAIELLRMALERRHASLEGVRKEHCLDPIRSNPRFTALMETWASLPT